MKNHTTQMELQQITRAVSETQERIGKKEMICRNERDKGWMIVESKRFGD